MTQEIIEALAEQEMETLKQWEAEALQALRAGSYMTSAATGGGVQYAMARSISPQDWLTALRQAIKLKQGVQPTVGQCATIIFTHTAS